MDSGGKLAQFKNGQQIIVAAALLTTLTASVTYLKVYNDCCKESKRQQRSHVGSIQGPEQPQNTHCAMCSPVNKHNQALGMTDASCCAVSLFVTRVFSAYVSCVYSNNQR